MKKKIAIIGVTILVLLAAGAVAWSFMSGKIIWNFSGDAEIGMRSACGEDIVLRYNDIMIYQLKEGDIDPSIDAAAVAGIKDEINKLEGSKEDATCQTLLFWIAIHNRDYDAANAAANIVKAQHDLGVFSNNNIRGNQPLFEYDSALYSISDKEAVEQNEGPLEEGEGA